MTKENLDVVLAVHPSAPHEDKENICGLSSFRKRKYRKNCRNFLDYARKHSFLIFHLRDTSYGEPPLEKMFGVKPDLEIPTNSNEGNLFVFQFAQKKNLIYMLSVLIWVHA